MKETDSSEREAQISALKGDVESHERTETNLREAVIYTRRIVDTVREPMLVLNASLCVVTASRAFYETFCVAPEVTIGRFIYDLGDGQWNIPALRTLLGEVLPTKNAFRDYEVIHSFPSLGTRVMLLNGSVLLPESGVPAAIVLAIEDVTDRKSKEAELIRSNEDLQRFAYVAAHDLLSPLRSGLMMLQLVSGNIRGTIEPDDCSALDLAISQFKQLGVLMNDILSYSEMGNVAHRLVTLSLEGPLHIALENLQHHIRASGATISIGEMPSLSTDRTQMVMVFQNLLSNAIKYRSKKPLHIQIAALQTGTHWRFSVSDNGLGFKSENASRIFEPFKRLHQSNAPGSGIGLATCKRVVEGLGGEIWAESIPGEGSTFFFTLPSLSEKVTI